LTRSSRLFLVFCCLCTSGSFAVAQNAAPEQEVVPVTDGARVLEVTSPRVRFWLTQAIKGAARRLRSPECRRVFWDFKDASGNLLETNLIRVAADPADYVLKFVWFADGSHESRCKGRIAAFTEPGSRVVFVCGRHFEKKSRGSELQIIHEILHSLGLGENPPSSDDITRQVAARCGGDDPSHSLTDLSRARRRGSRRTETTLPPHPPRSRHLHFASADGSSTKNPIKSGGGSGPIRRGQCRRRTGPPASNTDRGRQSCHRGTATLLPRATVSRVSNSQAASSPVPATFLGPPRRAA
jgi:hypothetical protein